VTAFAVEGFGPDGRRRTLSVEAADEAAARERAAAAGLAPLRIRTAGREAAGRPLGTARLVALLTELGALSAAQVPLADALESIAAAAPDRAVAAAARRLARAVTGGEPLSAALAGPGIGAPAEVRGAVRAGEQRGDLGAALGGAAATLARRAALNRRIGAALTYPAMLLGVTLLSVGGILLGVVPALAPVLSAAGGAAPASARLLLALSAWLAANGTTGLAGLGLLALVFLRAARVPALRQRFEALVLRAPLVGRLLRAAETAAALRTTAALLGGGTPLAEALGFAAGAVGTATVRAALARAAQAVREGAAPAGALAAEPALSASVMGLVAAGARAGRIAPLMLVAADTLEREVEAGTDRLLAILPPALTLVLGAMVGGVSLTIIGAILSVNDAAL
jgi:general secretion pathway protein F